MQLAFHRDRSKWPLLHTNWPVTGFYPTYLHTHTHTKNFELTCVASVLPSQNPVTLKMAENVIWNSRGDTGCMVGITES